MHKRLASVALGLTPFAAAQCPVYPDIGTVLPYWSFSHQYPIQPIGFAFPFAGATYTDVHITTMGMFYLSNAGVPAPGGYDFSATTAELVSGPPRICPMWHDMGIPASMGVPTGGVYVNRTATECTITWKDARCYQSSMPPFSIQCKLFPSGDIKFSYSSTAANSSTWSGSSPGWNAIVGASPGLGVTLPAANDLSAGGATLDNTLYEEWPTANSFNMGGLDISLIATNPGWMFNAPPPPVCASASNYGTGCLRIDDSYYEFFSTASSMDLVAGKTITMIRSATGYHVLDVLPGTFVVPGVNAFQVVAGNDAVQTVSLGGSMPVPGGTTSYVTICSNGHIALAATGNGNSYFPSVQTFLNWAQTVVAVWHDYNNTIAGSGITTFELVGGVACVTWNNVFSGLTTTVTGDTFQFQFDLATGNITLVFGAMTPAGNSYLVGYSMGGISPPPPARDLSTTPLDFNVADVAVASSALEIAANGVPIVGNGSFGFDTSNVPILVPLAIVFFGSLPLPGIDLGFIGAPDCRAYTNGDLGPYTFQVGTAGTGSLGLPIPMNPGLNGVFITAQSVAFSQANPLHLITSNGVQITIGN